MCCNGISGTWAGRKDNIIVLGGVGSFLGLQIGH